MGKGQCELHSDLFLQADKPALAAELAPAAEAVAPAAHGAHAPQPHDAHALPTPDAHALPTPGAHAPSTLAEPFAEAEHLAVIPELQPAPDAALAAPALVDAGDHAPHDVTEVRTVLSKCGIRVGCIEF